MIYDSRNFPAAESIYALGRREQGLQLAHFVYITYEGSPVCGYLYCFFFTAPPLLMLAADFPELLADTADDSQYERARYSVSRKSR
jgi:hypothetical protein